MDAFATWDVKRFSEFFSHLQMFVRIGNKYSLQELAYEIKCYINEAPYQGETSLHLVPYKNALCELLDEVRKAWTTAPYDSFIPNEGICSHCHGDQYMWAWAKHINDGKCIRCNGTGLEPVP